MARGPAIAEGRVHVSLGYSSFAQAAGGNYGARLHLVELPACALTTPQLAQCRKQTPVHSADNVQASRLGADVKLPGLAASGAVGKGVMTSLMSAVSPAPLVLAATAYASGSAGNFATEPASEADASVEIEYPTCSTQPLQPSTGDLCAGPGTTVISRNGASDPVVSGSGGTLKTESDGGDPGPAVDAAVSALGAVLSKDE